MNPFDTAAPSFDRDPIAMLYACHDKVRRFCTQARQLLEYAAVHGFDQTATQSAAQIERYFCRAAPLHHQDEEDDFFPLLCRYHPPSAAAAADLAAAHPVLEQAWHALADEFAALRRDPLRRPQAEVWLHFIRLYEAHLAAEEPLFEQGKNLIPAEALLAAGQRMAQRRRS